METEAQRIADQLDHAVSGPAWHGPAMLNVLEGVSAPQAAARPLPAAHSIHELLVHATAWLDIVRRRIEGRPPEITAAMDWPAVADWVDDKQRFAETAGRLSATIRSLDDARLNDVLRSEGDTWPVYATLHGVIQHVVYHAGQIAILKKGV